jgi:UDP-N-acetylglucosamine:LPS N-acetylglucosamine transferase
MHGLAAILLRPLCRFKILKIMHTYPKKWQSRQILSILFFPVVSPMFATNLIPAIASTHEMDALLGFSNRFC